MEKKNEEEEERRRNWGGLRGGYYGSEPLNGIKRGRRGWKMKKDGGGGACRVENGWGRGEGALPAPKSESRRPACAWPVLVPKSPPSSLLFSSPSHRYTSPLGRLFLLILFFLFFFLTIIID